MSTIKINTVSAGPAFITLTPGSTYEIADNTDFKNIVIHEKVQETVVSIITIERYLAADADENWEKLMEAAYDCIEKKPSMFGYPTYDGFSKENYMLLDVRNSFDNILSNALSNDLPAEFSEWIAWVDSQEAGEAFDKCIDESKATAEQAGTDCNDTLEKCSEAGVGGYYFNADTGLDCDCNSLPTTTDCCASIAKTLENDILAACKPSVTKKHDYIFKSVAVTSPEGNN